MTPPSPSKGFTPSTDYGRLLVCFFVDAKGFRVDCLTQATSLRITSALDCSDVRVLHNAVGTAWIQLPDVRGAMQKVLTVEEAAVPGRVFSAVPSEERLSWADEIFLWGCAQLARVRGMIEEAKE